MYLKYKLILVYKTVQNLGNQPLDIQLYLSYNLLLILTFFFNLRCSLFPFASTFEFILKHKIF